MLYAKPRNQILSWTSRTLIPVLGFDFALSFQVLGMKSYGRSSAFLLKIGHDQVGATSLRDARYCGAIWLCYAQY